MPAQCSGLNECAVPHCTDCHFVAVARSVGCVGIHIALECRCLKAPVHTDVRRVARRRPSQWPSARPPAARPVVVEGMRRLSHKSRRPSAILDYNRSRYLPTSVCSSDSLKAANIGRKVCVACPARCTTDSLYTDGTLLLVVSSVG